MFRSGLSEEEEQSLYTDLLAQSGLQDCVITYR